MSEAVPEVTPRPGTTSTGEVPFSSAGPIGDDRHLEVRFIGGLEPCFVLDHVDVEERPGAVVLRLYAGHDPNVRHVACSKARREFRTVVELPTPLGGRRVVDGALGGGAQ